MRTEWLMPLNVSCFRHFHKMGLKHLFCSSLFYCCLFGFMDTPVCARSRIWADSNSTKRIEHGFGLDFRPVFLMPANSFFRGANMMDHPMRTSISGHAQYAFRFTQATDLGRLYPNAYQGIGVSYQTFYNRSELGNPLILYVFQRAPIYKFHSNFSINYEWNFGASFGWHPYHETDNPNNTVVGSRINAYLNVGFLFDWQLNSSCHIDAGLDFTHFSNGNTHDPNVGINTIGARMGFLYFLGNHSVQPFRTQLTEIAEMRRHFSYDLMCYAAPRAKAFLYDGNPYLAPGYFCVLGLQFAPMYRWNPYWKTGLSLDLQYDESANVQNYVGEKDASGILKYYRPPFTEQFAVGVSVRGELTMPVFSINAGLGWNVLQWSDDMSGFYQVLALKASITRNFYLHIGYQLSRFSKPDHLMLGVGFRFL